MEGERRRKTIRSNEITADFVQINARVTTYGDKTLEELFPKVEGEKAEKKEKAGRR
jgi:small subunit ribosomal protein S6e